MNTPHKESVAGAGKAQRVSDAAIAKIVRERMEQGSVAAECFINDAADVARELAQAFVRQLRDNISFGEFIEMRKRNAKPEYRGCCASHDFIDANEVMASAFHEVVGRDVNCDEERSGDVALWNEAWDMAKAEYLTAKD